MEVKKLKVDNGRQYYLITTDKAGYFKKTQKPPYTMSVPEKNADEFEKTIRKAPMYDEKIAERYKEKPAKVKLILQSLGGFWTGLAAAVFGTVFGAKKQVIAAVAVLGMIPGVLIGTSMFNRANNIMKNIDNLGTKIESDNAAENKD